MDCSTLRCSIMSPKRKPVEEPSEEEEEEVGTGEEGDEEEQDDEVVECEICGDDMAEAFMVQCENFDR